MDMDKLVKELKGKFGSSYEIERPCSNCDQGCTRITEHLSSQCDYRPIQCPASENCSGNPIKLKDLVYHLQDKHKPQKYSDKKSSRRTSSMEHPNSSETGIAVEWFDGRMFLVHSKLEKGVVYQWSSVIGEQSVADKYEFIMNAPESIHSTSYQQADYPWNLPVVPIQQSQFAQACKLGCVGDVDAKNFILFRQNVDYPIRKKLKLYSTAMPRF